MVPIAGVVLECFISAMLGLLEDMVKLHLQKLREQSFSKGRTL